MIKKCDYRGKFDDSSKKQLRKRIFEKRRRG